MDPQAYLQTETTLQLRAHRGGRRFFALGNSSLEKGDPQQARRAFQAAYGLSTHDAAFNEDARVQLHNIKLQQALIGLNVRQSAAGRRRRRARRQTARPAQPQGDQLHPAGRQGHH